MITRVPEPLPTLSLAPTGPAAPAVPHSGWGIEAGRILHELGITLLLKLKIITLL